MDQASESHALNWIAQSYSEWLSEANLDVLATAAMGLLVVVLLRKPLASLAVLIVEKILGALSITLSDQMQREFSAAMRVILVASAALLTLDVTHVPDAFDGVLTRLLISVLVLAVFATWYRLIDPFVAVLDPKRLSDLTLDTSWVVRIAQFIVVLLAITALLAVWDIDISNALTGVGVFGAGLAIAAQDFVRNLFAGMANMSEKRFAPGDWIAVEGGVEGIVSRVDVRSTTILGFDRVPRYVPNADLGSLHKSDIIVRFARTNQEPTRHREDHFFAVA